MRIGGSERHRARLKRLASPEVRRELKKELFFIARKIETEAKRLIKEGAVSGPGHIPSAPGEPPNADTHVLDQSIKATSDSAELQAIVEASAPYAQALEGGTSTMAARPFMEPAARKFRGEAPEAVAKAIRTINRR